MARENFRFGSGRKKFSRHSEKKVARVFRKTWTGISMIPVRKRGSVKIQFRVKDTIICIGKPLPNGQNHPT
ncbi:hypothetical protein CS550_09930 [Porphyromonas gingivalis]|nr:hypothetical protein CS550_09930 [Porphyromonas gingivalis]